MRRRTVQDITSAVSVAHFFTCAPRSAQPHAFDCLLESSTTRLTLCPNSGLFCSFRRFLISPSDDAHFFNDAHNVAPVSRNTHLIELVLTWLNHVICIPERLKRGLSLSFVQFSIHLWWAAFFTVGILHKTWCKLCKTNRLNNFFLVILCLLGLTLVNKYWIYISREERSPSLLELSFFKTIVMLWDQTNKKQSTGVLRHYFSPPSRAYPEFKGCTVKFPCPREGCTVHLPPPGWVRVNCNTPKLHIELADSSSAPNSDHFVSSFYTTIANATIAYITMLTPALKACLTLHTVLNICTLTANHIYI